MFVEVAECLRISLTFLRWTINGSLGSLRERSSADLAYMRANSAIAVTRSTQKCRSAKMRLLGVHRRSAGFAIQRTGVQRLAARRARHNHNRVRGVLNHLSIVPAGQVFAAARTMSSAWF